MNSKYRYLIPNGVTLTSMMTGIISILLSATAMAAPAGQWEHLLWWAGFLIVVSAVLDLCDGALARKLHAGSEFGLQLDSLVDMVSFGAAPTVLCYVFLQLSGLSHWIVWPLVVLVPLGGAFRLARFNLLPAKSGKGDSAGLPITSSGAVLALAVLANLPTPLFPTWYFLPFLAILTLLMVSTIEYPSFRQILGQGKYSYALLAGLGATIFFWSLVNAWLLFYTAYLGFGVARAGYRKLH